MVTWCFGWWSRVEDAIALDPFFCVTPRPEIGFNMSEKWWNSFAKTGNDASSSQRNLVFKKPWSFTVLGTAGEGMKGSEIPLKTEVEFEV